MSDEKVQGKEFSEEYVKELRNENASWRNKYRELEARMSVSQELVARGIQADPAWVSIEKEETVAEAVDRFVTKYPHLKVTKQADTSIKPNIDTRKAPPPLAKPAPNTENQESLLEVNSLQEIKKDPVARKQLREKYRELLQSSSHQKDPSNY